MTARGSLVTRASWPVARRKRSVGAEGGDAAGVRVVLHIEADPDALAGVYKKVSCEIEFHEAGPIICSHGRSL
jgi:hypothetical protein